MRYVYDPPEIKERLPIVYAGAQVGVQFGPDGKALCPFHDDTNPSLELMAPGEDGEPWWYCRACGANGDVISLVQRQEGLAFFQALIRCSELIEGMPANYVPPPPPEKKRYAVTPEWEERLQEFQGFTREHSGVGLLSYAYGFTKDSDDLAARQAWDQHLMNWGWCLDEGCNVVIPHRTREGRLTAVKVRYRNKDWRAFGSFSSLYGSWLPVRHRALLLCEGESDCVWADANGQPVTCRALPSGANAKWFMEDEARWCASLGGTVYLGFDNDEGGIIARKNWGKKLKELGVRDLRLVVLPPQQDLRSSAGTLDELLKESVDYNGQE